MGRCSFCYYSPRIHFYFLIFHLETGEMHHLVDRAFSKRAEKHAQGQHKVSVTTQDVLGCLGSDHSVLTLQAEEVWLSLVYMADTNSSWHISAPSCWLQVRGLDQGVISMFIFNMTCSTANRFVVHSRMWNRDSFHCDPRAWLAPGWELTMTSNLANISIEINDASTPFSLHAVFKTFSSRGPKRMEVRHVTDYLGKSLTLHLLQCAVQGHVVA